MMYLTATRLAPKLQTRILLYEDEQHSVEIQHETMSMCRCSSRPPPECSTFLSYMLMLLLRMCRHRRQRHRYVRCTDYDGV